MLMLPVTVRDIWQPSLGGNPDPHVDSLLYTNMVKGIHIPCSFMEKELAVSSRLPSESTLTLWKDFSCSKVLVATHRTLGSFHWKKKTLSP